MSCKITRFTTDSNVFTKTLPVGCEGKDDILQASSLVTGGYETIDIVDINDLRRIFESTTIKQSYCYGATEEKIGIVCSKRFIEENSIDSPGQAISRTLDWFKFSEESGVLYIDYDVKGDAHADKPLIVLSRIFTIIPELESAPVLVKPSASSYIWDIEKNDWLIKESGLHIYFLISDQSIFPSVIDMLHNEYAAIDGTPKSAVSLDYHSINIEDKSKFEKRDPPWLIMNEGESPCVIENVTYERIADSKKETMDGKLSIDEMKLVMLNWSNPPNGESRHRVIVNYAHGMIKDIGIESIAIMATEAFMNFVPEVMRDKKWHDYLLEIPRFIKNDPEGTKDAKGEISIVILDKKEIGRYPTMPDIKLPEGMQFQREQFMNQVYKPNIVLMRPYERGFSSVVLNSKFLTPAFGRVPTLLSLGLSESASGKGLNSDVIHNRLHLSMPEAFGENYIDKISSPSTITAESSFLQEMGSEERDKGMLWLVPEADNNIANFTTNPSMRALTKSIKDLYDGHKLAAIRKSASKSNGGGLIESVYYPNASLAWYSQPVIFFKTVDADLLSDGFLGRFDCFMGTENSGKEYDNDDDNTMFDLLSSGFSPKDFDQDYLDFLYFILGQCSDTEERITARFESGRHLGEFSKTCKRVDDPHLNLYLKRIAMSAEKELTVFAAWEYLWKLYREGGDVIGGTAENDVVITEQMEKDIIPWCEYQLEVKEHHVFSRVGEGVESRRNDEIRSVVIELSGTPEKAAHRCGASASAIPAITKIIRDEGLVPRAAVSEVLRDRGSLGLSDSNKRKWFIDGVIGDEASDIYEKRVGRRKFLYVGETNY